MNDIYWKRRTMTVAFQRMFEILGRWNNNQVTPSLSKPHELNYRSNKYLTDFMFYKLKSIVFQYFKSIKRKIYCYNTNLCAPSEAEPSAQIGHREATLEVALLICSLTGLWFWIFISTWESELGDSSPCLFSSFKISAAFDNSDFPIIESMWNCIASSILIDKLLFYPFQ